MAYRLKPRKVYRTNFIGIRCTDEEKNRIQLKANLYTEGNISEYMLFCALEYEVKRGDIEREGAKAPYN